MTGGGEVSASAAAAVAQDERRRGSPKDPQHHRTAPCRTHLRNRRLQRRPARSERAAGSHRLKRRQPIVTPICRGRTSPQSAQPGGSGRRHRMRRSALGRARAGAALLNTGPLLRRPALLDRRGTDAPSWACGDSALT